MTPDERERLMALCRKISYETDHQKFAELTLELSYLLEREEPAGPSAASAPAND